MRLSDLSSSGRLLAALSVTCFFALCGGATAYFMPGMAGEPLAAEQAKAVLAAHYVGSKACQSCHEDQFARWIKTRMANVVTDPKLNPAIVIPDFSKPDPLVKFGLTDVDLVYGSKWKQRYFHKVGDEYFPYPVQWDITNKLWRPYHVADGTDWWAALYPDPAGDNSARPTGPLCDGCHTVNYNIETKTASEVNVGCESCHGAGSAHVDNPVRTTILNPARQNYVQANDTCIACHSQGQPLANPIQGKHYDWPVGYKAGLRLADFWKLEEHKLGELSFTHFPDGTGHKNRMQGNDYVQSLMYTRGITCFSCHDPHGTENDAILKRPANQMCQGCHVPGTANGPSEASVEAHTHHAATSKGSDCTSCHMPLIEQTVANISVASHTFKFHTPGQTEAQKIPNACNSCHKDKDTAWAKVVLQDWGTRSPWRVSH